MSEQKTEELAKNVGILGKRKIGIAAQREAAMQAGAFPTDVTTLANRLGMVFDDSGSMAGEAIQNAKEGCEEFFKVCNPSDTAIALYDMDSEEKPLSNDLIQLIKTVRSYGADAGTPLYSTLRKVITKEPINRAIVFSDGSPTDKEDGSAESSWSWQKPAEQSISQGSVIDLYINKGIPIDCVYIGPAGEKGEKTLQDIARRTGGIFLHFKKGSSTMKDAFKYLAPKFRAMLTDGNFRRRLEEGQIK